MTDVGLRCQSSLSLSDLANSADLQTSAAVELWSSEQSDSIQATGGHALTPQGRWHAWIEVPALFNER